MNSLCIHKILCTADNERLVQRAALEGSVCPALYFVNSAAVVDSLAGRSATAVFAAERTSRCRAGRRVKVADSVHLMSLLELTEAHSVRLLLRRELEPTHTNAGYLIRQTVTDTE